MARRERKDSKYLRLTGMWESKKEGLFTGRLRTEDVEKLEEKVKEAGDAGVPLVFFLWENEKDSRKDPDFTLQVALGEEEEGGRRGSRRSSKRDRDEDDNDDDKSSSSSKRSSKRDEKDEPEEDEPRGKSKSKKGKEDW